MTFELWEWLVELYRVEKVKYETLDTMVVVFLLLLFYLLYERSLENNQMFVNLTF